LQLTADDPLAFLFSLERLGMKFGLENITTLCAALGDPQRAFSSVIVAGTNGKGSVTAMVERGLRAAGHRSGRYTSPHLTRLEERFVIDGREVETETLRNAVGVVEQTVHRLLDDGRLEGPPTFFEVATAAAFLLFRNAQVDVAVLEVGLGGRLDSTNVVAPIAAAITSIDFDHQAQLGTTLEAIAREKAGVIKPGIPVVCGPLPAEAETVIRAVCDSLDAKFIEMSGRDLESTALKGRDLSLKGAHQRDNGAVAVGLLRELDVLGWRVPDAAVRSALTEVEWPGRLEEVQYGRTRVLLDAAHNTAGARALATFLRDNGWTHAVLVFGAMRDKDATAMLTELAPVFDTIVCTTAQTPRAAPAGDLAAAVVSLAPRRRVEVVESPTDALHRACTLADRVVVAGSIFLIGPLRDILRRP
jgi:dihydrofolate synthase/folylpolyglutamate synthase